MANNRINKYVGAIALGTMLMAVPGCTDTWDDHYDSSASVSGTDKTLWDVIKSNPNYSNFARILERAKYYKDDQHPMKTYSYADILSGGQVNTVWVPDNSVFTEAEAQKWLDMLDAADAAMSRADEGVEVTDATDASLEAGYNVQQQLIGNHIALWRHNISEPGVDTIKMINGKNLEFDKTNKALEKVPLGDYNIPTANGVLHVLKGVAPFHYNFYEYLKFPEEGKARTKLGDYVVSKDTTYFSASGSIEGLPDENGNPTYVDSVYFTSNRLFEGRDYLPNDGAEKWQMVEKGFHARINNEDSVFVMVIPTDAAWNAAYEKLKDAYKYAAKYDDKSKGDLNNSTIITIQDDSPEKDSLQRMSLQMDLISPLVFNIHKQPKVGEDLWTIEKFVSLKGQGADYLLNTRYDTLRAVGDWEPSMLFDGEPVEMSNGIGFEVSTLNFPKEFITPDVEVEIENSGLFYNTQSSRYKMGVGSKRFSFSNEVYEDITNIYGKVSNGNFYHFDAPGPTSGPKVDIKLLGNSPNAYVPNAQVMSGKYDIQIVVVPHWYIDIANAQEISPAFYVQKIDTIVNPDDITDTTFVSTPTNEINQEYVQNLANIYKYKIKATVSYNNNATNGKDKTQASKVIDYDGLKVDTLTVLEDFEFPYSYKNMRFSYPTLYIEGSTGRNDAKNGYVFDLVVDKIILKRKD